MPYSTDLFTPDSREISPQLAGCEGIPQEFPEGLDNGPGAPGRLMRITGTRDAERAAVLAELGFIAAKRGWIVASEAASDGFLARIVWRLVHHWQLRPPLSKLRRHPQCRYAGVRACRADIRHGEQPVVQRGVAGRGP